MGFRNVWDIMPGAETSGCIYFFFSINSYRFTKNKRQTANPLVTVFVMKSYELVSLQAWVLVLFLSLALVGLQGLEKLHIDFVPSVWVFNEHKAPKYLKKFQ